MTAQRLFVALFVVALFSMGVRETLDPDMWWHLRTGEAIVQTGIPRQDIFSFTVPDQEWVAHEWLSQVVMWAIYQVGGLPALILFFAGIIALTYWLIYLVCAGRPYLAAFVVLLAAVASAITWGARPQMFNLLLMALFVFLVERVRSGRYTRRVLWLLPVLNILWANLHSGYLLGVVLLATYAMGEAGEHWLMKRQTTAPHLQAVVDHRSNASLPAPGMDPAGIRLLALVTVLCFLAAVLNPNGIKLWSYPLETLGSSAMQNYIQEWRPPDFHLRVFWPFAALIALGIGGWMAAFRLSRRPPAVTDVLLFGGTAAASLLSARHIPLFALIAAPVVARTLWLIFAGTGFGRLHQPSAPAPSRVVSAVGWLVFLLAIFTAGLWTLSTIAQNETKIAETFPVAAVDYLAESGLATERGYNDYGWGGYLIWRGLPVFVDGRADVYADPFLFYYLQTLELQENWREPLDDFAVSYVLLAREHSLGTLLTESGDWQKVYTDDIAEIYVRGDAPQ